MTKYKGVVLGKVVHPKYILMEEYGDGITVREKICGVLLKSGRIEYDADSNVLDVVSQTIVEMFYDSSKPEFVVYESHLDEAVSYLKSELEKL